MKRIIILIAVICLVSIFAHAQTNVATTNSPAALPDTTAADWAKALGDIHVNISATDIGLIFLIVPPLLRKIIPDKWQANKLGLALAHANLEVNPTIEKLAAAATQPPANAPKV